MKRQLLVASTISLLVFCFTGRDIKATIISMDTSFGQDTMTLDTNTGLGWLDITLSTPYSYDQILLELMPGGGFDGFRLAALSEVTAFWQNAGIPTIGNDFVSENYAPIRNLMGFVGITGLGAGNLGDGRWFDFVLGHTADLESGGSHDNWVYVATLGAYDGDLTGRASYGVVPRDNSNPNHGSWLVKQVPCNFVLVGDLDDNCMVNLADLALMAANWLTNCFTIPTDPACVPK